MQTLQEYKCPACGGALAFDADAQQLKCPYCDTTLDVAAMQELEQAAQRDFAEDMRWQTPQAGQWSEEEGQQLCSYTCQSCGGQILTQSTTAATRCPYCDSTVVAEHQLEGQLRPDLVVPFQLSRDDAIQSLSQFVKGKVLLPKSFHTENTVQQLQGVYVPFWFFDADAAVSQRYRATRLHRWSDPKFDYVRTDHFSLHRGGKLSFRHVPVDGSKKMDDAMMESLEPFDLTKAVDFHSAYLAGFLADKFDLDADSCMERANERIRASAADAFADTVSGYATVIQEHNAVALEQGKVQYGLLPVWLLTTRYRDKEYRFAINGQTGRMVGNLPMDIGKFYAMLAAVWLGAGSFFTLIAWLLSRL